MKRYHVVCGALLVASLFPLAFFAGREHPIAPTSTPASFAALAAGAPGTVNFIAHDALGRTKTATATYNSLSADGKILVLDYTSDQYLCSGFEP